MHTWSIWDRMRSFPPTTRDDLTPQVMWRLIRCWDRELLSLSDTPLKINMEPNNRPIEKENHLPNLHFFCSSCRGSGSGCLHHKGMQYWGYPRRRAGGGGGCCGALARAAGLGGAATRPRRATWGRRHGGRMKGCAARLPFPRFPQPPHMDIWRSEHPRTGDQLQCKLGHK